MKKYIIVLFSFLFIQKTIAQWSELGGINNSKFNSPITCITNSPNGNLYVAGAFTDGNLNYYVAKWNDTTWIELGDSNISTFNNIFFSITTDTYGNVYAAGEFKNSKGMYFVAKWNGITWTELGGANTSNFNGYIRSVTTDINGNVYAAGGFLNGNGKFYVAKWDGNVWSELGGSNTSTFGEIINITTDKKGNLYADGYFTNDSGNEYVAKWNGNVWSELGGANTSTFNNIIQCITTDANGNIYIGGRFTNDSGYDYVAKWDGNVWSELGGTNSSTFSSIILAINTDSFNNVYAGGQFFATGTRKEYVAKYNGITWSKLGNTSNSTFNSSVTSITTDAEGNVYAAGGFVNGNGKQYVAKFQQCPTAISKSLSYSGCNSVTYSSKSYTASTVVYDTARNIQGCDSVYNTVIITVNKLIPITIPTSISGCNNVVYKGKTYTSSAIERDTIRSVQGCDSIYNVVTITVNNIILVINSISISGCNSFVYKGITYTSSSIERDTVRSIQGCDSIYNVTTITINKITPVLNPISISGCNSIVYKGITYTSSAIEKDTIQSIQGCDSIYNTINIIITKTSTTNQVLNLTHCNSIIYKGVTYSNSTYLFDTLKTVSGCDSIYLLVILNINKIIPITNLTSISGCNSVVYKAITYTSSSIINDTVKSFQGCDSVYNVVKITINKITPFIKDTSLSSCISVIYAGITYSTSTTFIDTLRSIGGCDSIYYNVNIGINLGISGGIYHPSKGYTILNVSVFMTGTNAVSNINTGNYDFNCLQQSANETIRLYKNNDINKSNGVTALDVALVQSHILQKNLLNSPYKIIAADVTGDGIVSVLDIVYIKRVILGIDTTFTNSTTKQTRLWAFVDSTYKFPDSTNPFPFKDSISYTGLSASKTNQTFIGCKLGDVNWDWNPAIPRPMVNNINAIELSYSLGSDGSKPSDPYIRIPVRVKNFKEMLGMQFTISFNANVLQWQGIGNNPLGLETGTNHAAEGSVSFLWVDAKNEIKTLEDGSVLMELVFNRTGNCSNEQLDLNSSITAIAAYDKDYNLHGVIMNPSFINSTDIVNETWTVAPNPTTDGVIHIKMNLKNSKSLVFRLSDITGRVLLVKQVEGIKGINNITLKEGNIPTGTYYLQSIGVEGEEVKKIMVN